MWVRKSSIRPVPSYARIDAHTLQTLQLQLLDEQEESQERLDLALERLDQTQPIVSQQLSEIFERPFNDATLALGYFLCISVWMSFDLCHGRSLKTVSQEEWQATCALVELDESLRKEDPAEAFETDDLIAYEQPALVRFIRQQMESALDHHGENLPLRDVQAIYRLALVELLALSYAVRAPVGYPLSKSEILA